jgi:hypothetical protein
VAIVKLDIQKGKKKFKLTICKWVSKYKINNITSKYMAIISPLSLYMLKEEDKTVKSVP